MSPPIKAVDHVPTRPSEPCLQSSPAPHAARLTQRVMAGKRKVSSALGILGG